MDTVTILEVSALVLSYFMSPFISSFVPQYSMAVALLGTWFLVRWMVRVKSEERDSGRKTEVSLFMPKSIWSVVTLAIALFHIMDAFLSLGLSNLIMQIIEGWASSLFVVQVAVAWLQEFTTALPVLSAVISLFAALLKPVLEQPDYFLMLLMFFVLEVTIHPELRSALRKTVRSGSKGNRGKAPKPTHKEHSDKDIGGETELYEDGGKLKWYFLKEEHKWRRVLYHLALLILFIIVFIFHNSINKQVLLFPLYVITEFCMAVAVPTRKEFFENCQKQDGSQVVQENFNAAISYLNRSHTPKILRMNSTSPRPLRRKSERLGEQPQPHVEELVQQYISLCQEAGESIDLTLAEPAKALLRGKSVVFSTRFYQDMDYSFCLPMVRTLQSGHRCLIVSGEQINMQPVRNWLLKSRQYLIGDTAIWRMHRLGEPGIPYQPDVGYMLAEDLGSTELMAESSDFLSQVQLVLIINASVLLHKQLFGLVRLRRCLNQSCTFAICNDNAEGLTDIYSQLLQIDLNLVYPSTPGAKQSYFVHIDEERVPGCDILECRQLELSRQLLENCSDSQEGDVIQKVRWYSKNSVPVKDIASRHGILYSADEYDSPGTQANKLVFGLDDANCPREDISCVIVEDEIYNPAELVIQFASRGRLGSLVAVFSPYYLFRDFIRNNQKEFYEHRRKIIQTFPAYCMSERNAVLQMMWNMLDSRLDERDISTICALLGQAQLEVRLKPQGRVDKQALAQVFQQYTGCPDMDYYLHYEHKFADGEASYEFWLDGVPDIYYDRKRPCRCTCASFGGQKPSLPQYSKIQLQQCFLPGQTVSIGGRCYEVRDIWDTGHVLELSLRRNAQCAQLGLRFRQKRSICLEQLADAGIGEEYHFLADHMTMHLTQLTAGRMVVSTIGSWMITGGKTDLFSSVRGRDEIQHQFVQKNLLCVELSNVHGNDLDCREITQCLMFEFSELFRTIYAEYEHQLLVCKPIFEADGCITVENFGQDEQEQPTPNHCRFYIIEDSEEDIGLLDSIRMHMDRLLRVISELEGHGEHNGQKQA